MYYQNQKNELSGMYDWSVYTKMGQDWLQGKIIVTEWQGKKLNPKQIEYVNSKKRYVLASGGMRSGKTMAFIIKLILLSLWFPNNRIVLGRDTRSNLEKTTLRDFFELCPSGIYDYRVKEGIITFGNGSEIVTMGLASSASGSDIDGAEQRIKGMNLGAAFIDQAEEVEQSIFEHLTSRLSNTNAGIQQIYLTGNPANYWALDYFKMNPRPNTHLIEMSMVDNKDNLPPGYLEDQLTRGQLYVSRFVYGNWDIDNLTDKTVFGEDVIKDQIIMQKEPLRELDGIKIFQEPEKDHEYQIGVDTSEASEDPCGIVCVDKTNGEVVAYYNAMVPVKKQVEIAMELGFKYNKALIIPEAAGTSGGAFIQELKQIYPRIYERKQYNKWDDTTTNKLGWNTNYSSKTMLIEHFKELLSKRFPKIRAKKIIDEFKTFVWSDEAKQKGAGAQKGFHDDLVMATLLAFWEVKPVEIAEIQRQNKQWERFSMYKQRFR